jgi:polyribonucleotide nucleotidyltransferase
MVERLSVTVGSQELSFETGRIAKQAHGAVIATLGETMVLSAVTVAPSTRPGQGFLPLTVDYRERASAAGRIPGNFFRREARPSEREVLTSRLTDRPLRPLVPKGFSHEIMVCQTVFSADNVNDPDVVSINAASAALCISKVPFGGPIGAVRVGRIDGELVVNPSIAQMEESDIDLLMAGTLDAIAMVEGSGFEISEVDMLAALEFGHGYIKLICAAINELRQRAGVEKMAFEAPKTDEQVVADVEALVTPRMNTVITIRDKQERGQALDTLKEELKATLSERYGERFAELEEDISQAFRDIEKRLMRQQIVNNNIRIDGRDPDTVRQITIELGVLPRTHGSCLFTRGETQALVTTTLGTSRDEQKLDELTGEEFRSFMLHYNFPPWSVGEVRRIMGPGRREIGHGRLAQRAIETLLPSRVGVGEIPALPQTSDDVVDETSLASDRETEAFPYTIRVVSDITESNGSSSMATVCGGSLSLMDAGVPIKAAVAGVAMGLIKEGDKACVLTDILGAEDHLGDMDFKICGTSRGITAFQMDIKISGISSSLMETALEKARVARLHILGIMNEALSAPRPEVSPYAPRIYTIKIDVDKIRDVIGPGGKVVRQIQERTGAEINIENDGTINVAALDHASADLAIEMIKQITADVEVGKIYRGIVTRIMNFGAFVSVLGGKEGLVHISELAPGRVEQVTDVVDVGDEVEVKIVEIDKMGRVNMSKLEADREMGRVPADAERGEGGQRDRGGDRGGRSGGDRGGDRGGRRGGGDRGGRGGDRGGRSGGR